MYIPPLSRPPSHVAPPPLQNGGSAIGGQANIRRVCSCCANDRRGSRGRRGSVSSSPDHHLRIFSASFVHWSTPQYITLHGTTASYTVILSPRALGFFSSVPKILHRRVEAICLNCFEPFDSPADVMGSVRFHCRYYPSALRFKTGAFLRSFQSQSWLPICMEFYPQPPHVVVPSPSR